MISPSRSPFVQSKGTPLQVSFTEMLHIQSLLWPFSQSPQLRSFSLQVPLTGPLWREMPVSRAFSNISQNPYWTRSPDKSNILPFLQSPPVKEPIIPVLLTGPLWRYAYFQSLCVHTSQRTQWKSCPNNYLAADKKKPVNVNNSSETWIDYLVCEWHLVPKPTTEGAIQVEYSSDWFCSASIGAVTKSYI
jgi:hypothetical protein